MTEAEIIQARATAMRLIDRFQSAQRPSVDELVAFGNAVGELLAEITRLQDLVEAGRGLTLPPEDARRISIMFNRASSLRTDQDLRLNAWLKAFIVACEKSRHSPDAAPEDGFQTLEELRQSLNPPPVL